MNLTGSAAKLLSQDFPVASRGLTQGPPWAYIFWSAGIEPIAASHSGAL